MNMNDSQDHRSFLKSTVALAAMAVWPLGCAIQAFIQEVERSQPAALLLINFWNSFSVQLKPILAAFKGPHHRLSNSSL